jgi:putative tricarboxylic transport membrane protein
MKNKNVISAIFWMVLGVGVCYEGIGLELGPVNNPSSGFMIFWLGLIMTGLSLGILFQAVKQAGHNFPSEDIRMIWSGVRWKKVAYVLVALSIYALVFKHLGFLLSTFSLLIFLFKAIEPQRWPVAILSAGLSVLAAYLLFQRWLGTHFPTGFLGIG